VEDTATPIPGDDLPYPNPNDGIVPLSVRHTLSQEADKVTLTLYTVSFRKIHVEEFLNPGVGSRLYSLDWEGAGLQLGNGIYYWVLAETRGDQKTRKIMKVILLK